MLATENMLLLYATQYHIAGNFVGFFFRYGEPQNGKLTHENLDSRL